MALLASTGLRNALLDTGSLKSSLADGFIKIYQSAAGDVPTTADQAITASHTLLLTIYGDGISAGLNLGTASAGQIGKDAGESWSGTVTTTGTATFFRFVAPGDTGASSSTQKRLQGRVGVSGAELNISSLSLTAGNTQAINFISINMPG